MIVAVTNRVLVYDAVEADLLQSLRGHKGTVFTVAYSSNGKFFASGGADNTIIIWNSDAEGQLKYNHNDPIQKLAYNPVTQQLISCTASDFGLWSPEAKAVQKHKVQSRILCADWTKNGQFVALGMYNGVVSIRHNVDNQCEEKFRIEKSAPVWCLAWNPNPKDSFDVLAVGCWDQTLSFHNMDGPNGTELSSKNLGYNPCDLNFTKDGEYFVIGGSNRKVTLMTAKGISLGEVAERESWVWSCTPRPGKNFVAVGANDGNISMYQQIFNTVHGLYGNRYAYRDNMTDVILQPLVTEKKIKIFHKDYVKKIAVYKDRLAVQLPDRVAIYEAVPSSNSMKYQQREKIKQKITCNLLVRKLSPVPMALSVAFFCAKAKCFIVTLLLLVVSLTLCVYVCRVPQVVTSLHIILCLDKKLQLMNFKGKKEREWVLDSGIRYIKVIGGPPGREGLLAGLKNGTVLKIFVDNPFPIKLIKQTTSIRCLDLNCDRTKLAVVDENAECLVYDVRTKELLYKESDVNSVAWNSEIEDMIAMSGNNTVTVKIADFVMHTQKQAGFVVGFSASKLFCLQQLNMQVVEVPQSQSLQRYIKAKDFKMAIRVACLGVTEADWKMLGLQALYNMEVDIARESFLRINNLHLVTLTSKVEQDLKNPNKPRDIILGDILAYEGKFMEAEKLYCRNQKIELAIQMYSDLWKYDEAKRVARMAENNPNIPKDILHQLNRKQAEGLAELGKWREAAEMFLDAGDFEKAIEVNGKHKYVEGLIDVVRRLDKDKVDLLKKCAVLFIQLGKSKHAKEVYLKIGDSKSLVQLYVKMRKWEDAFGIMKQNPGQFEKDVYLPYAEFLALNDKFDEAQKAYRDAGLPELSLKMLGQLTHNAVSEHRFKDAAFYFWLLAQENVKLIPENSTSKKKFTRQQVIAYKKFRKYQQRAKQYYAYSFVYQSVDEPFTGLMPIQLFNISRYLLNTLQGDSKKSETPFGISRAYVRTCVVVDTAPNALPWPLHHSLTPYHCLPSGSVHSFKALQNARGVQTCPGNQRQTSATDHQPHVGGCHRLGHDDTSKQAHVRQGGAVASVLPLRPQERSFDGSQQNHRRVHELPPSFREVVLAI